MSSMWLLPCFIVDFRSMSCQWSGSGGSDSWRTAVAAEHHLWYDACDKQKLVFCSSRSLVWRLSESCRSYTAPSIEALNRRTSGRLSRRCRLVHLARQSWETALSVSSMSFAPLVSLLIPFGACCDAWQELPSCTEAGSCTLQDICIIYVYSLA